MTGELLQQELTGRFPIFSLEENSIPPAFQRLDAGNDLALSLHQGFMHGICNYTGEEYFCLNTVLTRKLAHLATGRHRTNNGHILNKHPEDIVKVAAVFAQDYENGFVPDIYLTSDRKLHNLVVQKAQPIWQRTERPLANIIAHEAFANFIQDYRGRFDWNKLVDYIQNTNRTSRHSQIFALMELGCPQKILQYSFRGIQGSRELINFAASYDNGYYKPSEMRYKPKVVRHSGSLYERLLEYGKKIDIPFTDDVLYSYTVEMQALPKAIFGNVVKAFSRVKKLDPEAEHLLTSKFRYHISTRLASIYMGDVPGTVQML